MNTMLVISGIWIAILPRMKWYSLELKKLNIGYYCIGLYIVLLGVLSINEIKIYDEFFVLAFISSALLEISTIILRLKGEKNILDIAAIVVSVVLLIGAILIGALSIAIIDIDGLISSITAITGALFLLSISYKSVITKMKI